MPHQSQRYYINATVGAPVKSAGSLMRVPVLAQVTPVSSNAGTPPVWSLCPCVSTSWAIEVRSIPIARGILEKAPVLTGVNQNMLLTRRKPET